MMNKEALKKRGGLIVIAIVGLFLMIGTIVAISQDAGQSTQTRVVAPKQVIEFDDRFPAGYFVILAAEGHTLQKHIGLSVNDLRRRLDEEPIPAASTFVDVTEAENAIRDVLVDRENLIQEWLNAGRSTRKAFYIKTDIPVGTVLERGALEPVSGNQTRVVLIRDELSDYGYFILTAYPEFK